MRTDIKLSIASTEKNQEKRFEEPQQTVIEHIDSKYDELSEQIVMLGGRISSLENDVAQQSTQVLEMQM